MAAIFAVEPDPRSELLNVLHEQQLACAKIRGIVLSVEAFDAYKHPKSGVFTRSEKPTIAKVWINGIMPNRLKIEYQSKITPVLGGSSSPFTESVESLGYDGATVSLMINKLSSGSGELTDVLRGRIQAADDGSALRLAERVGVYGLTLPNIPVIRHVTTVDPKNPEEIQIKKSDARDPAMPDCVQFLVVNASLGSETAIWLDLKHGSALRRMETKQIDSSPSGKSGFSQRIDVEEFQKLEPTSFYFPTNVTVSSFKDDVLSNEMTITVKELKAVESDDGTNYNLFFPVGTRVQDARTGTSFIVGNTPEETLKSIRTLTLGPQSTPKNPENK